MLPGPGLVLLVSGEGGQRHREHALGALRAQPRVDVVERPGGGADAQRRGDPAGEAVVIIGRDQRFRAVAARAVGRVEQINEVEVGGMGQRLAAQPPEREDDEFAACDLAVR